VKPDSQEQEEEEKRHKVVDLRLLQGGKEPPSTGETWLEKKPIGACFLVKEKNNPMEFNLGLFRIDHKTDKAVILHHPPIPNPLYVDPVAFCNKYREFEDLGIMLTRKDFEEHDRNRLEGDSTDKTDSME